MHKSKGSKHNLVLDRQKAKEFLAKREELRQKRLTNVRETDNGALGTTAIRPEREQGMGESDV